MSLLYGCATDDSPKTERLSFEVIDSLLGPAYVIERADIQIRPPAGFEPIADSLLHSMRQQFAKASGFGAEDSTRLDQFFFDSTSNAALVIATVGGLNLKADTGAYVQSFVGELNRIYGSENVKAGDYMVGNVLVKNYVAGDSVTVRQTLLCLGPDSDAAEMQFVIPRAHYAGLLKSLESSIGTVTLNTQED